MGAIITVTGARGKHVSDAFEIGRSRTAIREPAAMAEVSAQPGPREVAKTAAEGLHVVLKLIEKKDRDTASAMQRIREPI